MIEREDRMTEAELAALIETVNSMSAADIKTALNSFGISPGAVQRFNAANYGEEVRYDLIYIALLQARYNELVMGAAEDVPEDAEDRIVGLETGVDRLYGLDFEKTGDGIGAWEPGYGVSGADGSISASADFSACSTFLPIPLHATHIEVYNTVTDGYVALYNENITRDGKDGFLARYHYSVGRRLFISLNGTERYARFSIRIKSSGTAIEGATPETTAIKFQIPLTEMLGRIEKPVVEKHMNGLGPMLEIAETYLNEHYSGEHPFEYLSQHNLFANEIVTEDGENAMTCSGLVEACLYAIPFGNSRYVNGRTGINERESWGLVTDGTGGYAGVEIDNHESYMMFDAGDPEYKLTGQLIKYFELRGNLIPYSHQFANMKPGDILLYVGNDSSDESNDAQDNHEQAGDNANQDSAPSEDTSHYKDAKHVAICLGATKNIKPNGTVYCSYRLIEAAAPGHPLEVGSRTSSPKSWGQLGYIAKCPVEKEYVTTKIYENSNRYTGNISSTSAQAVFLTLDSPLPRGFYTIRIKNHGNNPLNQIWMLNDEDYESPGSEETQPWTLRKIKGAYLGDWTENKTLDTNGNIADSTGSWASEKYYTLPMQTKWISVKNSDNTVSGRVCVYARTYVNHQPVYTYAGKIDYSGGTESTRMALDPNIRYCIRMSAPGNNPQTVVSVYAYDHDRAVYMDNNCGIASVIVYLFEPTRRFSIRAVKGKDSGTQYNYDISNITIYKGYYPD